MAASTDSLILLFMDLHKNGYRIAQIFLNMAVPAGLPTLPVRLSLFPG